MVLALLILHIDSFGQGKIITGQYFQNLPAFSPSFTGANDFLDIRTGIRSQWAGFDGAPTTAFLSAYSPIRLNSNGRNTGPATSSPDHDGMKSHQNRLKLGAGGHMLIDDRGPFQVNEGLLNFAVHIPVAEKTYLSLGMATGFLNARVNLSEITVEDGINDETYLSYMRNGDSNTFLTLNSSLGLHSDRYYVSYSAMQMVRSLISGNEDVNNDGADIGHHIIGGYRFFLNEKWELIPNTFLRIVSGQPLLFEVGARVRYSENLWAGLSYRKNGTYVGMVGMDLTDVIHFAYAFEYRNADFDNFNNGSHEVTLGLRLFNRSGYRSMW